MNKYIEGLHSKVHEIMRDVIALTTEVSVCVGLSAEAKNEASTKIHAAFFDLMDAGTAISKKVERKKRTKKAEEKA